MDEHDLEYDEDTLTHIEQNCRPIIKHFKNFYNRPRPYQVAEKLGLELNKFETDTSKTPAYPSGHATQATLVGEYYSKMYPQHSWNHEWCKDMWIRKSRSRITLSF